MAPDTIPHRLFAQAEARPGAPAYHHKVDGRYRPTSWGAYATLVRRAAKALIALGFERGATVSILGFNRPEWVVFDVAAMAAGGAGAGIYTTCSPEEVRYIIHHAESPVVLLENAGQWKKVEQELERLPLLRHVVMMEGAPRIDHPLVMGWAEFLEKGAAVADERLDERLAALEPGGLASLIYTSGTTGPPKGVMLTHRNLAWTSTTVGGISHVAPGDVALSYLPLSHIAEQVFSIHGHLTAGYEVYFAESIEKVPDNLKEVEPTIFFGVPRIWEKFHAGITGKLQDAPRARRAIAEAAMRVAREYHARKNEGRTPHPLLEAAHRLGCKLVSSKVKKAVGLGRAHFCVSGAAPIAPAVLEFFAGLDLPILRGVRPVRGHGADQHHDAGQQPHRQRGPAHPGRRGALRRRRGDPRAGAERLPGLLQGPGGHGRGAQGRLALLGRPRQARRARQPRHHGAQEGDHHHRGRQEHHAQEHREQAQGAPAHRRGGGDWRSPQVPDRAARPRRRRRRPLRRRAWRGGRRTRARAPSSSVSWTSRTPTSRGWRA